MQPPAPRGTPVGLSVPIGLGLIAGVILAWFGSPGLEILLFNVQPRDPLVLGGALTGLIVVAAVSAFLPVLRATGVDPAMTMRSE